MATIEIKSHKKEVLDALNDKIAVALETIGLRAERHAKEYCPVDTGRLRNSISHAIDDDSAYIGTNVEYAPYVELGTNKQRAEPYLKPAVQNHVDEYRRIVEGILRE